MAELQKEKKVEYLELVYDLIFVYIIGRNNSLLHNIENGFVPGGVFLTYLICMLAIIQIWNFSTFYINIYGRNSARDHVFLFINMFLLYFMADGISMQWQNSFYKFCVAWILILLNIAIQHLIELRNHKDSPEEIKQLKTRAYVLFGEIFLIVAHILVYTFTGHSIAYVAILFGIIMMIVSGRKNTLAAVDFSHLAERAMLFVVFTFGEMIIAIAPYFEGKISLNNIYFSGMAFLIVVSLLLSYGTFYNKILDKELTTNGINYMAIHIFIIFALNNISKSLEFMREETVALVPKMLFLVGSILLYYIFLLLLGRYSKLRCGLNLRFLINMVISAAIFVTLMIVFREKMYINIALTLVYTFGMFLLIYKHGNGEIWLSVPTDRTET